LYVFSLTLIVDQEAILEAEAEDGTAEAEPAVRAVHTAVTKVTGKPVVSPCSVISIMST
jgi:hypothetical protein